jgi:HEAT repeat protein
MQRRCFIELGLLAAAGALGAACNRRPRTVHDLVGLLRHPDPAVRRRAADDLRMDGGVPAPAIQPLLDAIAVERDKKAHGAMLITLGKSGVPEAKPHIDGALPVPDEDVRRWAARALKFWLIATGRMHPDQDLPSNWPYGQPGYPPPLP